MDKQIQLLSNLCAWSLAFVCTSRFEQIPFQHNMEEFVEVCILELCFCKSALTVVIYLSSQTLKRKFYDSTTLYLNFPFAFKG